MPIPDQPHLLAPSPASAGFATAALPRQLGFWSLWLLVINGLIGAGIFGLPAGAARLAGDFSLWLYPLCALLILPVLLCFAELSSRFAGSGGPAVYVSAAFGPAAGFQAGWLYYLARLVSVAANTVLLVDSVCYFLPALQAGPQRLLLLVAVLGAMTLLNVWGVRKTMRWLGALTVAKLAVLVGFALAGCSVLLWPATNTLIQTLNPTLNTAVQWQPLLSYPDIVDGPAALLLLVYAFVGFESALIPAGEAKNPQRDLPRALISALLLVTLLYMAVQAACLALLPDLAHSKTPLLDATAQLATHLTPHISTESAAALISIATSLLMLGIIASVAANLLGAMFSTPRLSHALAEQGQLPAWFAAVHPRFLTPAHAIWFFGGLALLLASLGSFLYLAAATVLIRALLYGLCCAALPVLRRQQQSPLQLPLATPLPWLACIVCLWLASQVSSTSVWLTAALIALGLALSLLAKSASKR
ncbi:APC family permease [Rheinheimera sp. F8]|uniref:APC family permease n=1 Tax=Rheinheimera sp. F8 TaxID=1763998 RepID=UPI000AABA7A2|nr:APC family permease [Rheinheimera sp. F8]